MALICISVKTHNIEHIFLCPFVICISSLLKCLLKSAHFHIRFFVFLLMSFDGSLKIFLFQYFKYIDPLSSYIDSKEKSAVILVRMCLCTSVFYLWLLLRIYVYQ